MQPEASVPTPMVPQQTPTNPQQPSQPTQSAPQQVPSQAIPKTAGTGQYVPSTVPPAQNNMHSATAPSQQQRPSQTSTQQTNVSAHPKTNKKDNSPPSSSDKQPPRYRVIRYGKSRSRSRSKSIQKMKTIPQAFLLAHPFTHSPLGLKIQDTLSIAKSSPLPNVLFYSNQTAITYRKFLLQHLHTKLRKNFEWMEDTHDYIQWMFPNHYRSRFNYSSHSLNFQEAKIFRESRDIGERMVRSFEQYMDFIGIQVYVNKGSLRVESQDRLRDALVRNTHNHLRIRRILACLSVTGFRPLALWFINILDFLIGSQKCLEKVRWGRGLRFTFEDEWAIYGNNKNGGPLASAIQNCFPEHPNVFSQVNQALPLDNLQNFLDIKKLSVEA